MDTIVTYWNEFLVIWDNYLKRIFNEKAFLPVIAVIAAAGNMIFVAYGTTGTNQIAVTITVLKQTFRDQDLGPFTMYQIFDTIIDLTSRTSQEDGPGFDPASLLSTQNLTDLVLPFIQTLLGA